MVTKKPIILFDGVCNLCNGGVQFVLSHDKKELFLFSSLQSDYGQQALKERDLDTSSFSSFILIENGQTYYKSTAALRVSKKLSGLIKLLWVFIIVPRPIRDWVYSIIANNRYKWFGKQNECWLPTPDLKSRFLN